ncbi:MAG: hypothetical protein AB7O24_14045 [Kofleriaceae bacterium]
MAIVLGYLLALAGLTLVIIAAVPTLNGGVKYSAAKIMLINLLRTDPNQAERLCGGVKGTFFEAVTAAIKTAAMTMSRDPKAIASASLPAFDAAGMGVTMQWKQRVGRARLGCMMAGIGLGLTISNNVVSIVVVICVVVALAGWLWVVVRKVDVERSILRARGELLPEVDRAFVDGRYTRAR